MSDNGPQKTRLEVADLLGKSAAISDGAEKRKLASRAFALAQSAEAAERSQQENRENQQRSSGDLSLDENLKIVAQNNLTRFLGCLYVETEKAQRELYRTLLLQEEQCFAMREERLEMLQRLLRDCDGRLQRQEAALDEQRAAGMDVTVTETLMKNMLETQALLRDSFQNELRWG
jgi:hypothetical protein